MALTSAKLAYMVAARARARAGRTESAVLVSASAGTVGYTVVDVVWVDRHDAGAVRVPFGLVPGVSARASWGIGSWDASIDILPSVTIPSDIRYVARCASVGLIPTSARYVMHDLDKVAVGGQVLAYRMRLRRSE